MRTTIEVRPGEPFRRDLQIPSHSDRLVKTINKSLQRYIDGLAEEAQEANTGPLDPSGPYRAAFGTALADADQAADP